MMSSAEKGSLAYQEKQPSGLFSETKTQKQLDGVSRSSETQSSSRMGNYYENASQKAKLILPKALWILIVIAGLCFLALLSSLNRTINTLDTLVEIEQANAAKLASEAKKLPPSQPHQHHRHDPETSSFGRRHPKEAKKESSLPLPWLSMPGWTSLEPRSSHSSKKLTDNNNNNNNNELDRLFPHLSGSVIIESSSSPLEHDQTADSLVNSIFGSFLSPMLNVGQQTNSDNNNKAANKVAPKSKDSPRRRQPDGPSITANIDNLSININSADDVDDHGDNNRAGATDGPHKRRPINRHHRNKQQHIERAEDMKMAEMGSLDKSIDELMARLAESMSASGGPSEQEAAPALPFGLHISPMALGAPADIGRQEEHHHQQHNHRVHHQHQPEGGAKLVGGGSLLDSPLSRLFGEPLMLADELGANQPIPPMFGRPRTSQFVIALDGSGPEEQILQVPANHSPAPAATIVEAEPVHRLPGESEQPHQGHHNRHHQQRRPSEQQHEPPSPYELIQLFGQQLGPPANSPPSPPLAQSPPFVLPDELANSLAKELIDQETNPDSESFVLINGAPFITDKKQSLPMEENAQQAVGNHQRPHLMDRNQAADLFQLFFGPPPNSDLVVSPQIVGPIIAPTTTTETKTKKKAPNGDNKKNGKEHERLNESLVEKLVVHHQGSTVKPEAKGAENKTVSSASSTTLSPAAHEALKDAEHLVNDLLGSMFTLPQFGANQGSAGQPARTDNGGSSSSSSSSSPSSPSAGGQAATETTTFQTTPLPGKTTISPASKEVKTSGSRQDQQERRTPPASKLDIEVFTPGEAISSLPTESSFSAFVLKPEHLFSLKPTPGEPASSSLSKQPEVPTLAQSSSAPTSSSNLSPTTTSSPPSSRPVSVASQEVTSKPVAHATAASGATENATPATQTTTKNEAAAVSSTTTRSPKSSTSTADSNKSTDKPLRNLLQKADDFLERNIFNLKRFLN